MSQNLQRTHLYSWHVDHDGRIVPFAGWEMPVQYSTGPIAEHHLTRRAAGLFDIDHMGQFSVTGPDAAAYLNRLVTWDVTAMAEYDAHYALLCYENGGIVDDVFIYRLPNRWLVVVNAANLDKDEAWLRDHAADYQVTIANVSAETYMLALQGPHALAILRRLTPANVTAMPRFTALEAAVDGVPAVIGHTGYTGEDGVELFFPAEQALTVWQSILNTGAAAGLEVGPIGLAARDSLRFEAGLPLYGHEISADITPLEANLGWACRFNKDFVGKEALLIQKERGLTKKLVYVELIDKGVPRQNYPVVSESGEAIGVVASGMYAPTADKYCAHVFVRPDYATVGCRLAIVIRDTPKAAVAVKGPFYIPVYRR
jgi:aminomethyltransferase